MKSIKTFFALCCAMFIGALYAANETPMQLFKTLREAAINNDTATALQLTGGELLVKIKDEGTFPGDLRQNLLFIKAAFEDIHVRLANPATAEIHAFYLLNGKMEYLNIKLEQNENSVMKIISMTKTQYTAEPFLKKFLEACHTNSIAQYRDMITPELAQQHKTIPNSFKASVQETITPGKSDSKSAVFTVDRNGIKGNIKMVKNGYFWKAASIDAILIALLPAQIVENFSNAAKSTRNVDELKEFLLSGGSAVKKLNEQEISRFAGLSSIDKQTPIGRNKYNLDAKISSETETGTISVELVFIKKYFVRTPFPNQRNIILKSMVQTLPQTYISTVSVWRTTMVGIPLGV